MQVLQAGGVETIGAPFHKVWKETIEDANKRGFFETRLRRGIFYATNPDPETGRWLQPQKTRRVGIKVFIPGVVRSDVCFLSRVVASVRPFRQYAVSVGRLFAMERESLAKRIENGAPGPLEHMDPILEWWLENFLLVRDITTRRYPVRLVSYEAMLEDPEKLCSKIFTFFECGDAATAAAAVHPEDRTQTPEAVSGISHRHEEVFDEYHHRVKAAVPFDAAFLKKMNETHVDILPEIVAELDRLSEANKERKELQGRRTNPVDIDRLDRLLHPAD